MTCFLWTKMIKRKFVYEGLQNGIGLWYGEDQIGVFTMLLQCKKLCVIPDRLYYYVQHEGQVMAKYNYSLWDNIFNLMGKYKELDKNGNCEKSRRQRTWIYIIFTICVKMKNASLSKTEFCDHISKMRNSEYMKKFFQPCRIGLGIKDELKYWILKFKLYLVLYQFCK